MRGLHGLDGYLTKLDSARLSVLDRARLSALHSGAFMSQYEHSIYDNVHSIEDDRLHWLQCPRYQHIKDAMVDWRPDTIELPHCPRYQLLVPRPHCMVQWRSSLSALDEDGISFLVSPPPNGHHHLFLDGLCSNDNDTHTPLNLAAWGVVNATLGQPVASAPLAGITQTIDRAELMSLMASLQWVDGTELGTCLWSDSHPPFNMAEHIWRYDAIPDYIENVDLWTIVQTLLRDRAGLPTDFRWIPSHLPQDAAADPFEDWIIHWNNSVDQLAGFTNRHRPDDFLQLHRAASSVLYGWMTRIRQLRSFDFQVADMNGNSDEKMEGHVSVASSSEDEE